MTDDYRIVEIDEDDGSEIEFTPAEYGYLWIRDCCLMHQWCSGARQVDDEVVEYAESLANKVRLDLQTDNPNWSEQDLENLETLVRYLKANMETTAEPEDGEVYAPCSGTTYTYSEIREAHPDNFRMVLTGEQAHAFVQAVMIGIDSRLEACFVEARGDVCKSHTTVQIATLNDQAVVMPTCGLTPFRIEVEISAESMPVLLRRLTEFQGDEELAMVAETLGEDILAIIFETDED